MKHLECKKGKGRGILVACAVGFGLTISMAASVGLRADAAARKKTNGRHDHRVAGLEEALAANLPKLGYFSFDGTNAPRQDGKKRTEDGNDLTLNQTHDACPQSSDVTNITIKIGPEAG